jgi:lipid-binding SYLF domain-containing protein
MTFVAVLSLTSIAWAGSDREQTIDRMDHAGAVLHEIMAAPDKGIPEEVLEHAKCVAVVPHLLKGGFVFGAENGRGVATCRTANGWSAPAFFTITGGSWGLQIGVEGVDLVMIIQNDRGMHDLMESKFEIGGDASAAAGPVGRHASANTDWKLETEILTYSRARGAFAGLTLTGAAIRRDDDSTEAIYGHDISTGRILRGEIAVPDSARHFLDAVMNAKAKAAASNYQPIVNACRLPGKTVFPGCLWNEREKYALDNLRGSSGVVAPRLHSPYRRRPDPPSHRCGGHRLDLQPGHWKQARLVKQPSLAAQMPRPSLGNVPLCLVS